MQRRRLSLEARRLVRDRSGTKVARRQHSALFDTRGVENKVKNFLVVQSILE